MHRYTITRVCLNQGSLRVLKYLEPLFSGYTEVRFQDEQQTVFTAQVQQGCVYGLSEYYQRLQIGINDILQLSAASNTASTDTQADVQADVQANVQANVQADIYIEVARRPQRGSSYSKPTPKAAVRPATPVAPQPQRVVVNENAFIREIRSDAALGHIGQIRPETKPKKPEAVPVANMALVPQRQWLEQLAHAVGYGLQSHPQGVVLRGQMRGKSHDIYVFWGQASHPNADLHVQLLQEDQANLGTHAITQEALQHVLEFSQNHRLTAEALLPFWHAQRFNLEGARQLCQNQQHQELDQRRVFSQVLLLLSELPNQGTILLADIYAQLPQLPKVHILESIETLTKPPFNLVRKQSAHALVLQQEVQAMLRELEHYAQGLRANMRPTKAAPHITIRHKTDEVAREEAVSELVSK